MSSSTPPETTRAWVCLNCGWTYDQAKGDPMNGIAPGTAWEDVPDDWKCPDCGSAKSEFEMMEI
jgi:rubredoxin